MLLAAVVLKFVPVIVTVAPTTPLVGLKLEMVGDVTVVTVKLVELVAVRPPTVTVIAPVVAPEGTVVEMLVAVGVPLIVAVVPLNFMMLLTAVVLKFTPVIVTAVATEPEGGLNEEMLGKKSDKGLDQTPPLVPAKRFVPLTPRE